jgi:hypothetical protein
MRFGDAMQYRISPNPSSSVVPAMSEAVQQYQN